MKYHSSVGLISNSSTSIIHYPRLDALGHVRNFLQMVMTSLGVEGSVDDYFEIGLERSGQIFDVMLDEWYDQNWEELPDIVRNNRYDFSKVPVEWQQRMNREVEAMCDEHQVNENGDYLLNDTPTVDIFIRPKTTLITESDIVWPLYNLFDAVEINC